MPLNPGYLSLQVMLGVDRLDMIKGIPQKLPSERRASKRCTVFRFCNARKP